MLLREFWNDRFWPYCMANLRESSFIDVNANGTMTYANQGGTQGTDAFGMTVSYAL